MSRVNCDIVRDLLPSYLDGICSESSRKAVEQHTSECRECRASLERLKNAETEAGEAVREEIDFLKKVKRYRVRKSVIGAGLFFGFLFILMLSRPEFHGGIESWLLYGMLPLLMVGSWMLFSDYKEPPKLGRGRIAAGAVSVLGLAYSLGVGGILLWTVMNARAPFGMEMFELGPFLNVQLVAAAILEYVLFLGFAADAVRKEHSFGLLPVISLAGCILSLIYRSFLYAIESFDSAFTGLLNVSFWILAQAAVLILAGLAFKAVQGRKSREASDE